MRVISPTEYYHDLDKTALRALKAIPGFTNMLKSFLKVYNEQMLYGLNMASKIRLGPEQMPEIYNLLPPICKCLGISEPELYLEMNPSPNAYTFGDSRVFITLTSGLIECMNEDELKAVIAHECGHIACRHVLYHTMANMLLNKGAELFDISILTTPLKLALYHWYRCSEFSCDRAAAVYMQSSKPVVDVMIRFAGGSREITSKINADLFLKQAQQYQAITDESGWNKMLQNLMLMNRDHPFVAVRAAEIDKWCKTENFARLIEFANKPGVICPNCSFVCEEHWKFCKKCGKEIM